MERAAFATLSRVRLDTMGESFKASETALLDIFNFLAMSASVVFLLSIHTENSNTPHR